MDGEQEQKMRIISHAIMEMTGRLHHPQVYEKLICMGMEEDFDNYIELLESFRNRKN